jgi:anti-sigma factor RsiW
MTDAEREAMEAEFSDYHDGSMPPDKRAAFEKRLAAEPELKREYDKFDEALRALSGLHKMAGPQKLDEKVADTIYRRSAGRFFGPRTLGDRVPFLTIAVVGMVVALVVVLLMRYSLSGALHDALEHKGTAPPADAGAGRDIMPKP